MKNNFSIAILLSLTCSCKAQNGLKTKEIFMYKNGFTYVHSEGKVSTTNGVWSLNEKDIPDALFGTFWFQSPGGIQYIARQIDSVVKPMAVPGLEHLLASNVGKKVKLTLGSESSSQLLEGTIINVFEDKTKENRYNYNVAVATIRTATGDVVITSGTLGRVLFAEFENGSNPSATEKKAEPHLAVYLKSKDKSQDLSMVYVARFNAWAPVYRLELVNDKKARLTLGAEIKAGKSDIDNASLNLVVASPNIYSAYLPSCLTNERTWEFQLQENSYSEGRSLDNSVSVAKDEISVGTGKAEDYHIYTVNNFSIKKNEAAFVQLLDGDLDVTHFYQCNLPYVNEYTIAGSEAGQGIPQYDVYHMLKFKNPFKQPLTAAPVFTEAKNPGGGNLVLGQPVLATTAIGAEAEILIAKSLDIPLTQLESEISRVEGAKVVETRNEKWSYDLVTVEAKVHLENQGGKEITVKTQRVIEGKPLKSDVEWKLVAQKPRWGSPNSTNEINWEIKLKPGEKKDFTYTYEYYIRIY